MGTYGWRIFIGVLLCRTSVAYTGILFGGGGGGSTNSVKDRENGDLGAVSP